MGFPDPPAAAPPSPRVVAGGVTTVCVWAEPPFAYRGRRLPSPSRGRVPPGPAGVRRLARGRACAWACVRPARRVPGVWGKSPVRAPPALPRGAASSPPAPVTSRSRWWCAGTVRGTAPRACVPSGARAPERARRMDGVGGRDGSRGGGVSQRPRRWGRAEGGARVAEAGRRPGRHGTASECRWRWDPVPVFPVARPRPRPSPGRLPACPLPFLAVPGVCAPSSPCAPTSPCTDRCPTATTTAWDPNGPRRAGVASGYQGRWCPRVRCSRSRRGGLAVPGHRPAGDVVACAGECWPWWWPGRAPPREVPGFPRGPSMSRVPRDRSSCWRTLAVRSRVYPGRRLAPGGSFFPSPSSTSRASLAAVHGPPLLRRLPGASPSPPAISRALPVQSGCRTGAAHRVRVTARARRGLRRARRRHPRDGSVACGRGRRPPGRRPVPARVLV